MLCDLVVAADDSIIGEPFMRMGGAQLRYTTSLNSWLRMAPPPPDSAGSMRDFMNERQAQRERGESTDYQSSGLRMKSVACS